MEQAPAVTLEALERLKAEVDAAAAEVARLPGELEQARQRRPRLSEGFAGLVDAAQRKLLRQEREQLDEALEVVPIQVRQKVEQLREVAVRYALAMEVYTAAGAAEAAARVARVGGAIAPLQRRLAEIERVAGEWSAVSGRAQDVGRQLREAGLDEVPELVTHRGVSLSVPLPDLPDVRDLQGALRGR
jgi:chromosome segregation ATPase